MLPPGPRLPAAAQTLNWVLRPVPFMEECRRRYGKVFTLKLGPSNVVMVAERELSTWPIGEEFALLPRMQSITVDVILGAVFGVDETTHDKDRVRALVVELLERCQSYSTMLPQLRRSLAGRSPWARLMRCVEQVDEVLYAEIARRRAASHTGDDVLSMLLDARDEEGNALSDRELRDKLLMLLVAGHETTASALAFAFERLLRHPDSLVRLTEELSWGEEHYLDAVIKETLRLRPVLPIVARKLTADFELAGWELPRKTVVMPNVWLVHRDADVYPDPEAFWPERFLHTKPDTYSWIPFGGGVRRCLGASFAQFEMRVVLKTVLSRAVLAARPHSERVVRRSFTFAPERGAQVVMLRRTARTRRFQRGATAPARPSLS